MNAIVDACKFTMKLLRWICRVTNWSCWEPRFHTRTCI